MMQKFFSPVVLTVFLLTSIESVAQNSNVKAPIELPPNFQYPNGIARSSKGILYVGSVTSGQILRIDSQAKSETFFPGSSEIFAANSLRLDEQRDILWGASSDFLGIKNSKGETVKRPHRIFAIDTRTGKVLRVIQMPDNGFGNDIALDDKGGIYLTDSWRPRIHYLAPGTSKLQVWAENPLFNSKQIGLAGIARRPDGVVIVGMFSTGELFKITPQPTGVAVEKISLTRKLENPDGMQFAPDGKLLVTEGSVTSGNGRLLSIDVLSPTNTPRSIETIAANMESPVNLTIAGNDIWVTESRVRHRLLPGKEKNVPSRFFVRRFNLKK